MGFLSYYLIKDKDKRKNNIKYVFSVRVGIEFFELELS